MSENGITHGINVYYNFIEFGLKKSTEMLNLKFFKASKF